MNPEQLQETIGEHFEHCDGCEIRLIDFVEESWSDPCEIAVAAVPCESAERRIR